jgi:hypothetical protein
LLQFYLQGRNQHWANGAMAPPGIGLAPPGSRAKIYNIYNF